MRRWGYALLGWAVTAYSAAYEPAPFSRYQPILDRMPFGALPPASNPTAADLEGQKNAEQLQAEQQQVAKQIAFTALNITPRGRTAVGFIDRSTNPPENFYLEVGASARGWTVAAADYDDEWAQFQKDGVTITMHLDKGLIDAPPVEAAAVAAVSNAAPVVTAAVEPPAAAPPVAVPGLVRLPAAARAAPRAAPAQTASTATSATSAKSYLERLRERKAQEKAEQHAADKATRESLQELARKIAQDEMAKREKENEATLQQLHAQQELLNAQQGLEAPAQMPEQTPEEMPAPDAVPAPEAAPEEQ